METLSDKRHPDWETRTNIKGWYLHDDVKEFIRELKEASFTNGCKCDYCKKTRRARVVSMNDIIELAGDKLT